MSEPEQVQPKTMKMLPAGKGKCSVCATEHEASTPHNYWSLFYQLHFKLRYKRDATHADAVAHCTLDVQEFYRVFVDASPDPRAVWSEPEGDPIVEPYAEA